MSESIPFRSLCWWVGKIADYATFALMPGPKDKSSAKTKVSSAAKEAKRAVKGVGRPRAKHSNPDYAQMSLYIHKDVRNKVKAKLFERGMEFSALVESMLRDWLNKQ